MTNTETRTGIGQVGTVFVPVADQDRALEFYLGKLGFERRGDFPYCERDPGRRQDPLRLVDGRHRGRP
jgi:catechol 2,3-dioxygenase-like lactoylglutathione lyase family enzyme